jgi:hypothetical protein
MKRALITIATVGILAPTAWVAGANAQQMSPGPAPSQAHARSQMTQAYAQRRVHRSARRAPAAAASARTAYAAAPAGTARRAPAAAAPAASVPAQAYAQASQGHFTWYASPGPMKRGNECITNVDALRGYGFRGPCKK